MEKFILNNKVNIPAIGLGTFPMKGSTLINTMIRAIEVGYTSFDTASAYCNHEAIGEALNLCDKSRENIFITSKLSNKEQKSGSVEEALKKTLKFLKLEYVDLYLIHWPNPETYLESWIQMEEVCKKGFARTIGVCNFHEHHLKKLLNISNIVPAVNQIELHPFLTQKPLVEFCSSYNIKIEAYSPLARMDENLIKNKKLVEIANKYNKTVPQIILRWNYQNGVISIPKTQSEIRLKQNIDIFDFDLSVNELKNIDELNQDFRVRHNPDNCDFEKL